MIGIFSAFLGALWALGIIGRSPILPLERARAEVAAAVGGTATTLFTTETLNAVESILGEDPPDDVSEDVVAAQPIEERSRQAAADRPAWGRAVADGLVYGSAAWAADPAQTVQSIGLVHDWLFPDSAAVAAFQHVTNQEFENIFDLRSALELSPYKLADPGSINYWTGHTFEHMVNEQVVSWAGDGALEVPPSASFAGPDVTMFGTEIQYKAYADFAGISDPYGSTLVVPEGTANVPSDAISLDFSGFDPAVLSEHSVFISEGVTRDTAEAAWRTLADPAQAGGLDDVLGDAAGEVMGDLAFLGFGAGIRAAASAYRRSEALTDPRLRERAAGKVAKDAGLGLGGAAIGGTLGTFILPGVGTAIGAAIGGMFGGSVAKDIDREGLQSRQDALGKALNDLEGEVRATKRWSGKQWRRRIDEADTRADQLRRSYQSAVQTISQDVLASSRRSAELSPAEQSALMELAATSIRDNVGRRVSPRTARRLADWSSSQSGAINSSDPIDTLALLYCVPGGPSLVSEWIGSRVEMRAAAMAAADMGVAALRASALSQRQAARENLESERARIKKTAADRIRPATDRVSRRRGQLEDELRINGL